MSRFGDTLRAMAMFADSQAPQDTTPTREAARKAIKALGNVEVAPGLRLDTTEVRETLRAFVAGDMNYGGARAIVRAIIRKAHSSGAANKLEAIWGAVEAAHVEETGFITEDINGD